MLMESRDKWTMVIPSRQLAGDLVLGEDPPHALARGGPGELQRGRLVFAEVREEAARREPTALLHQERARHEKPTEERQGQKYKTDRRAADALFLLNAQEVCSKMGVDAERTAIALPQVPGVYPNPLNLLNVNGLAVVPHQHTIRVSVREAVRIVRESILACKTRISTEGLSHRISNLAQMCPNEIFILREGETARLGDILDVFREAGQLDREQRIAITDQLWETDEDAIITGPKVLEIPRSGEVDILEAYIYVALTWRGVRCCFIDTSYLSGGGGNLHCATNRVPVLDDAFDGDPTVDLTTLDAHSKID
jgi:hypothetical protein